MAVAGFVLLAGCGDSAPAGQRVSSAPAPTQATGPAPPETGTEPAASTTAQPPQVSSTTTAAPGASTPSTAAVQQGAVRARNPYSDWAWPGPPAGSLYTSQELELTVLTDPGRAAPYFFAHQFGFDGGGGGYIGLQTQGNLSTQPNAPSGKIALFSVFSGCDDRAGTSGCPSPLPLIGASAQPGLLNGSSCSPLTTTSGAAPEGPGASCRVPFDWRQGASYRLRVALVEPHVWQGTVADTATGAITVIGQIRVPDPWQGLASNSVSWVEHYGSTAGYASCADLPRVQVRWRQGSGTASAPGLLGAGAPAATTVPTVVNNRLATGNDLCPNSSVAELVPKGLGSVQTVGGG